MRTPQQPDPPSSGSARPGRSSVVPLHPAAGDHVPTVIGKGAEIGPAAAFALARGEVLAHFEVVGPLGTGGMASVFKARDLTLGREVALKILPPDSAADPSAVARFKLEARAAAKLNHESVARVFFTGEDRGLHFIAFEFVEGETLRAAIERTGTVSPADCVRYLLHVAAGLHHAGERGVVHRDVKPSNIVVTPDGRAKLIDMGLARSTDPRSVNGGVTQSGMTLGTFDYISPEQAIDPRTADTRSDIYSLGCTFYHALTGRPPVPDGNAARKLAAHQTEAPTDPRLINPTVPDEVAEVLDRMMAKAPADRYATAGELVADLSRVARVLGVPTDPTATEVHAPLGPDRPPPARPVGRPFPTAMLMGGSALLVAVVVLVSMWSRTPPPSPLPWPDPPPARTGLPPDVANVEPVPTRLTARQVTAATTADLIRAIRDGVPKVTLVPGGVYDLTATDGLVATGKTIEWECPVEPKPATVRVTAAAPAAVTFAKCESVRLSGVRIEVLPPTDEAAANPRGLTFAEVGKVDLTDCRFEAGGPFGGSAGAGLSVVGCGTVSARNCYFGLKNWAAVELIGATTAGFTECGFVSAMTGIEVTAGGEPGAAVVTLRHTTFLLQGAAAATTVSRSARLDLTAGYSVFATPPADPTSLMMPPDPDRAALLVRTVDGGEAAFATADGQPNAAYRVTLPAVAAGSPPDVLRVPPWATPPKADPDRPWQALELNPAVSALRQPPPVVILGVRALPTDGRKLYATWPPPAAASAGVKVWHPRATAEEQADLPANVFVDLDRAIAAMKKGRDELEVRGSGLIEVPPVVLTDPKRVITLRPEKGSRPVLKAAAGDRRDAALFRLEAGELVLEGLAFQVKPGGADGTAAVVSVSGGRRCEFRNCVITLSEDGDERAAAVVLPDVSDQMKKDAGPRPAVAFENCLIRGRGRLVRAVASPPLDLTVTNVAAAVSGPLFEFGPPARTVPASANVSVHLSHLTASLGGPLFEVRTGRRTVEDKPTVLPIDVRADGCLVLPLEADSTPLVLLHGGDPTTPERCLTWTAAGPTGNGFPGWTVFVESPNEDTPTEPKRWDATDWRRWTGEREPAFGGRTAVYNPPTAMGLAAVRAADLELTSHPFTPGIGARVDQLPKADDDR
jgi:serine/threonine protein kinase